MIELVKEMFLIPVNTGIQIGIYFFVTSTIFSLFCSHCFGKVSDLLLEFYCVNCFKMQTSALKLHNTARALTLNFPFRLRKCGLGPVVH